jgi:hypothetical protein
MRNYITKWRLTALAVLVLVASCSAAQRQKTLKTSILAVDTARSAFSAWDRTAQTQIVDGAKSLAEGRQALEEHRNKRDRVMVAFEAAYRTLAFAAADPDEDHVKLATAAVAVLWDIYRAVVGHPPYMPDAPAPPKEIH